MPFTSAKQERYLWAKHPDVARRWADQYGSYESHHSRHHRKRRAKHELDKSKKGGPVVKHPGFAAIQRQIMGQGYSKESAGAILASRTRNASAAAKKKNPHLLRVHGKKKKKKYAKSGMMMTGIPLHK